MTTPAPRPMAERVACGLLAAAAIIAPLALGSSGIAARFALEVAMTTAVVLWCVSGVRSKSALAIPILVAAVLCLQVVPLPDRVLMSIAPVSSGAWKVANGGTGGGWASPSVDPGASLIAIRRLLVSLSTLMAVTDIGRYQTHRKKLTAALAISGIIVLGLGLGFGKAVGDRYLLLRSIPLAGPIYKHVSPIIMPVQTSGAGLPQQISAGGRRYVMDAGNVGDGFGPYIYSNHFAGAMVLTMPIVLGAWLFLTYRRAPDTLRYGTFAAIGGCAGCAVAVMAESRGGAAALVISLLGLLMLVVRRPILRKGIASVFLATCACVAFLACLLASGGDHAWLFGWFPDSLHPVMTSVLNDTRTIPAQVALRMFLAAPLLGTGLNTYQFIFPRFYRGDFTLFYAHSDYAQFFAETGIIGIILLTGGAWVLLKRLFRFWTDAPVPYRLLAAGPWAALLGFAVHSAFDWNLHLPANALLAVMACGLALSSVPMDRTTKDFSPISQPMVKYMLVACCLGAVVLLGRDSMVEYAQRAIRTAIVADRLAQSDSQKAESLEGLLAAIRGGERMADWDQRNAQLATLISNAYLHAADRAEMMADKHTMLGSANRWATRARRLCATPRGLAEVMPSS
jgi:hypothetical protein